MKQLIGKTIGAVYVSDCRSYIRFVDTESNNYDYHMYGDCCSESWIEHQSGLTNLVGKTVTEVEERTLGEVAATRQEVDVLYSITITAPEMWEPAIIEFRNSSNGYYGGSVEYVAGPGELDYEAQYYEPADIDYREITEDF